MISGWLAGWLAGRLYEGEGREDRKSQGTDEPHYEEYHQARGMKKIGWISNLCLDWVFLLLLHHHLLLPNSSNVRKEQWTESTGCIEQY